LKYATIVESDAIGRLRLSPGTVNVWVISEVGREVTLWDPLSVMPFGPSVELIAVLL
jgi:hypothetical protein